MARGGEPGGETRPGLGAYARKRDPARTPEPFGHPARSRDPAGGLFVVQQHAARRMHWDFRLEIEGVLASWAVPRGPSIDPGQKRLAVRTEDHPLEYADFEGVIPPGNYGAGAVIVWDRGRFRTTHGESAAEALARGKLDFELEGHKLRGRWVLVRTRGEQGKNWLLLAKDAPGRAVAEPVEAERGSVLSGLTVEEVAAGVSREEELRGRALEAGAKLRSPAPGDLVPMLASTARAPFSAEGWIFELKYDGVRALVERAGSSVRVLSRSGRELGELFPELALAARHLPCSQFVLDGEIVALDERGFPSFERIQKRLGSSDAARAGVELPVVLFAFDLLWAAGFDVRPLPLRSRREMLRRLAPRIGVVRWVDYVETRGEEFFRLVCERGLEGVVAKRADSAYRSGRRSADWKKIRCLRTADLAVVGFTRGKGAREALGSLVLGWRSDGGFLYAGQVGSGFDEKTLGFLLPRLEAARVEKPLFTGMPAAEARRIVPVQPELVAEVRYAEVTSSGVLRQPVFVRLRDDKTPEECDRPPASRETGEGLTASEGVAREMGAPRFEPTNLEKVFYPEDGITKGEVLEYYRKVWPCLAPYLRDRPLVLVRYPDGIGGKSFFQKQVPEFVPAWVGRCRIEDTEFFVCNELEELLYVVNLGCIPIHLWSSRCSDPQRPDWVVLDLDPKGAPFRNVVRIARALHGLCEALGIPHFAKTSGQEGLHVLLPSGGVLSHDEARTFAELLARLVVRSCGEIATLERSVERREGKVYVDYLQNGFGKTIVAPFSLRARPGAPVSAPLRWNEVRPGLDPLRYSLRSIPRRVARIGDPMADLLRSRPDWRGILGELSKRLEEDRST